MYRESQRLMSLKRHHWVVKQKLNICRGIMMAPIQFLLGSNRYQMYSLFNNKAISQIIVTNNDCDSNNKRI